MTTCFITILSVLFGAMLTDTKPPTTSQEKSEAVKLKVGDPAIDGSFIQPYKSEFKLTRKSADGKQSDAGRWTSEVKIIERDGRKLLRTYVVKYDKAGAKEFERVNLNESNTMAPLSLHQIVAGLTAIHVDIAGAKLKATMMPSADVAAVAGETTLEQAPFDLSLYGVLLAGFPLQEGYTAQFPVFGLTSTSSASAILAWETMSVGAKEKVKVGTREIEAWPVTTKLRPWTVWVTKEAPYELRVVQRFPDGSTAVSELIN